MKKEEEEEEEEKKREDVDEDRPGCERACPLASALAQATREVPVWWEWSLSALLPRKSYFS